MRYHKWPLKGTGTLYHSQAPTHVEITDRTYDWDKMLMSYSNGYTQEQADEVAKLMAHLGYAFAVTFGSDQTSVSDPQSTDKPNKFFDYKLEAV